jgi:hypothetical protein
VIQGKTVVQAGPKQSGVVQLPSADRKAFFIVPSLIILILATFLIGYLGGQAKEAFTKKQNTAQSEKTRAVEDLLWKRRRKGMSEMKSMPTKTKYSLATCPVASDPCRNVFEAKWDRTKAPKNSSLN